jgi:hypothetical protein
MVQNTRDTCQSPRWNEFEASGTDFDEAWRDFAFQNWKKFAGEPGALYTRLFEA